MEWDAMIEIFLNLFCKEFSHYNVSGCIEDNG